MQYPPLHNFAIRVHKRSKRDSRSRRTRCPTGAPQFLSAPTVSLTLQVHAKKNIRFSPSPVSRLSRVFFYATCEPILPRRRFARRALTFGQTPPPPLRCTGGGPLTGPHGGADAPPSGERRRASRLLLKVSPLLFFLFSLEKCDPCDPSFKMPIKREYYCKLYVIQLSKSASNVIQSQKTKAIQHSNVIQIQVDKKNNTFVANSRVHSSSLITI